jgi:formylglycine-generating enzyme
MARWSTLFPAASAIVVVLVTTTALRGVSPSGPVHVHMELVESPLEQAQLVRCEVASDLAAGQVGTWSFFYGEVRKGESGSWEAMRARTGCESGRSSDLFSSKQWHLQGAPYLMVDVSVRRRSAKDRAGPVELSISRRKWSGFSPAGEPSYTRSDETRILSKAASSGAVPLLNSDQKEKNAFRIHDVLLRIEASTAGTTPVTAYGEISVLSDTPRADILLDGGVVARTSDEGATRLENVLAGERELRIRDLSGREARKPVRVARERTAEVTLKLRTPSSAQGSEDSLVPLGKNPQGFDEYWRSKDGALLVRIPEGEFRMGSAEGEGEPNEHPQRKVYVSPYLIDKAEVTWGQYEKFSKATGTPLPEPPLWGMLDDYPVTAVIWSEAAAFCEWVGGRLPSEAEWEKAARGEDGRRYPWGEDWDPDRCNTRDGGPHRPRGVGVFPGCVSPYGALDMCGSVWEYCLDWYEEKYYETSPTRDPRGPGSGQLRVLRGGSWLEPSISTRPALRRGTDPLWRNTRHGFRCAQDAPDKVR